MTEKQMTAEEREQWLAIRKEAGLKIDPENAEVTWHWGQILDPYNGIQPVPEGGDCVGRVYFARAPGSDIWVSFYDLPEATVVALGKRPEQPDDTLSWLSDDFADASTDPFALNSDPVPIRPRGVLWSWNWYLQLIDRCLGGTVYHSRWMSAHRIPPVPAWMVSWIYDLADYCSGRRR